MAFQILGLFILPICIACIARTVVYEEVFREIRELCQHKSKSCQSLFRRKFFYLFTCEYCFSHYVTLGVLAVTRFHLMYADWRGYLVAFFALVFMANIYMAVYAWIKIETTSEKKDIELKEKKLSSSDHASTE